MLCKEYGKAPHEYLFNDLIDCAHFRLAIDMTVFEIYDKWETKRQKVNAKRAKLRGY